MNPAFQFDTSHIEWTHMKEGPDFPYPVDYKLAILGVDEGHGTLEMLIEFAPKSHCHYHRHIAGTSSIVLQGEHHLIETGPDGEEILKVRPAGHYSHSPGNEVHMERGGPEGSLVFFTFHSPTGHLFDLLDPEGNTLGKSTFADFAAPAG